MSPIRFKGGEFALIDWIRSRTRTTDDRLIVGPGDDACVLDVGPGTRVSLTTDMLLEGTHFDLAAATPAEVGWKCMGAGLSDVAAMGMAPVAAVCAVGLPESCKRTFAEELYDGMRTLADRFDVSIAGGDVTSWDASRLVACVTVLGTCAGAEPVLRSGARPGDVVVVTGELGGSALGRHVRFIPRVAEGICLAREYSPHAMIDISDGLSSDLAHVCVESGVGAVIDETAIPVSGCAGEASQRDGRTALEHALDDGEDFELLVTMSENDADRLLRDVPFETAVTVIGRIVEGDEMRIRGADGEEKLLEPGGYEHLRGT